MFVRPLRPMRDDACDFYWSYALTSWAWEFACEHIGPHFKRGWSGCWWGLRLNIANTNTYPGKSTRKQQPPPPPLLVPPLQIASSDEISYVWYAACTGPGDSYWITDLTEFTSPWITWWTYNTLIHFILCIAMMMMLLMLLRIIAAYCIATRLMNGGHWMENRVRSFSNNYGVLNTNQRVIGDLQ